MSSYLTFYGVPKKGNKEPIAITSYSRNTMVYQMFKDSINPTFVGIDDVHYDELTKEKIQTVYKYVCEEYESYKKKHDDKEKMMQNIRYAEPMALAEMVNELADEEEYIREMYDTKVIINEISAFVYDVGIGCTGFEKVLINVG